MISFLVPVLFAFLVTFATVPIVSVIAGAFGVVDLPHVKRKQHLRPTPLLGGWTIWLGVLVGWGVLLSLQEWVVLSSIHPWLILLLLIGGFFLVIGGSFDDRLQWKAHRTVWFPLMAAGLVVCGGLQVTQLTHPFGGRPLDIGLSELSSAIAFIWMMGMIYTTKLLDGIDGLTVSVGSATLLVMLGLTLTPWWFQPDVACLIAVVLASCLAFFFWNKAPARIFLGEGGSTLIGFLIGGLALISGAKIVTTLLACTLPMLDLILVIARRYRLGGLSRILEGDRLHLHHRLVDLGWSSSQVIALYTAVGTLFGVSSLFVRSIGKGALLLLLITSFLLFICWLGRCEKHALRRA